MIVVKQIDDQKIWNEFVRNIPYSPMTQAVEYGNFYQSMNEESFIVGAYKESNLVGGALVIAVHAKRGSYFYLPYGPLSINEEEYGMVLQSITTYLKEKAGEYNISFIRISPFIETNERNNALCKSLGFRKAPIHALAETTCILDLTASEEELMKNMNKNHRNLIRRCEKEGVKMVSHTSHDNLSEFHGLHTTTAKRHGFTRFSDEYVEKEFKAFEKNKEAMVFYAYLPDGTLDASAVVYFYGTTAAYRHGASLSTDNKIPTPYLVQWAAIREAKKRGLKWYNFWGVAPEHAKKNHPFKGITHFKKGFGGSVKDLIECQDLVIDSVRYWPTWLFETLRRIKRGF